MRRCLLWVALLSGAACGSSTEPGTVTKPPRGDKTPPEITNVTLPAPFTLVYRDTLAITFQVADPGGVQSVSVERWVPSDAPNAKIIDTITLSGRVNSTETVRFPGPQMDVHPAVAQMTIHAVDLAGNARDSTFLVYFTIPPFMTAGVTYKGQDAAVVPGDTVDLQISAGDGVAVEWLGYRLAAPVNVADSVAVTGTSASHDFPLVVTRDWVQPSGPVTITYFTRNSRSDFVTGTTTAKVVDGVRRTATRLPLHGIVGDAAFDTKRNVLYLSQPDSGRILLFSLATNTFGTPIQIGGAPTGLDLSVSGDSLLVALRRVPAIGIVDLTSGTQSQLPIQVTPGVGEGPQYIRMSANGLAIVTMALPYPNPITPSGIFEFDSFYRTVLPRTDPGAMAAYTTDAQIVRSADRQKILIAQSYAGSALYDATSNSFMTADNGALWALSTTTHGDRFLYGSFLYDGSLHLIRRVASPTAGPTVLTADGLTAYFGNPFGYQAFRTADDTPVAQVVSAPFTGRLLLTPSGDRLISITDSELVLANLP